MILCVLRLTEYVYLLLLRDLSLVFLNTIFSIFLRSDWFSPTHDKLHMVFYSVQLDGTCIDAVLINHGARAQICIVLLTPRR